MRDRLLKLYLSYFTTINSKTIKAIAQINRQHQKIQLRKANISFYTKIHRQRTWNINVVWVSYSR